MRIFKSHPLLKLVNSYVIDSPQPSNISFLWNFGSLLGFCLVIQIITGVTLAMHYNANVLEAFNSVEHIMRDVNNGWLIRYLHSNTASAFFFIVYLHIGRGLYYGSYKAPRTLVWTIGTVIFILMMATAFLGYVLPYGQMSLWGATVITSLMSAIPWVGQDIVEFIWGGFSVNNATLNRFFALHFVLPFVLAALALMHLIALHDSAGSGNPLGVSGNYDRLPFAPYFIFKDLITIFIFILILSMFVFFMPNLLGDSENYVMANPMQTPPAIVPEWYLLPFYAILRSIPNKLLGVIAMFSAILILLVIPFTDLSRSRGIQFKPLSKAAFFMFVGNFLILMELGAKHVESPFIEFGQISTVIYFAHFLIIVPLISLLENTLIEIDSKKNVHAPQYYMQHATVLSGLVPIGLPNLLYWWQADNLNYRRLFSKPFPSTLHGLLEDKMKGDLFSAKGNYTYCYKLDIWVREDGMVSIHAPLPYHENGTLSPWEWMTVEKYVEYKGRTMEDFKKSMGLDDESKKGFYVAKKRFDDAIKKRHELIEQNEIEDDETDERNGRPADNGWGRPTQWQDKNGNTHVLASYLRPDLKREENNPYYVLGDEATYAGKTKYIGPSWDNSDQTRWSGKPGPSGPPPTDNSGPSSTDNSGPSTGPSVGPSAGPSVGPSTGPPTGPSTGPSTSSSSSSSPSLASNNRDSLLQINAPKSQDIISEFEGIIPGLKDLIGSHDILFYLGIISCIMVSLFRVYILWCSRNEIIMRLLLAWLGIQFFFKNNKKIIIVLGSFILSATVLFVTLNLSFLSDAEHRSRWINTSAFTNLSYCDAPRPWGIYFQDSATPQMEGLVELHDNILFYLVIILFGVGWLLISIVKSYSNTKSPISHKYLSHGTLIELIWTITPALILILIAFPSFKLLYLMDEVSDPAMAVLAEGHQWYWSYQYPDFLNSDDEFIEFDSYLVPESDLEDGALRMLEVDNRLIIPELTHVRFIVTGADVIHSFACPALGIKCDAYPGRLNQVSVMINREGTFYGQCSEICGILHSSMPIVIESVSIEKFVSWLQEQ